MPDGRFVSKSIAHSEQLGGVSFEADYLFGRCIPHLDRDGRMTGHPALVKSTACPLRAEITVDMVPDLLRQLAGAGLVRWYECDGRRVLEFPGFDRHQKGMKYDRESASRFPASTSEGTAEIVLHDSGEGPAEGGKESAQVKLSEVKSSEGSETTSPAATPPPVVHTDEDQRWNAILAPIIRECWWSDNLPHREDDRGRPWTLARDMSLLKRAVEPRNGKPRRDPAELEPAIRGLRRLPTYKGRAVDARLLTERTVWALSVAAHWEAQGGEKKRRTVGGLGKIAVPARLGGAA